MSNYKEESFPSKILILILGGQLISCQFSSGINVRASCYCILRELVSGRAKDIIEADEGVRLRQ